MNLLALIPITLFLMAITLFFWTFRLATYDQKNVGWAILEFLFWMLLCFLLGAAGFGI